MFREQWMYINCGAPHCTNVLVIITQNGYIRKGGIDGPMDSATVHNVISLGVHNASIQLDRDPSELAEALDYVFELAEAALVKWMIRANGSTRVSVRRVAA